MSAEAVSLPTWCPSWCVGSHEQALEEGCSLEDASVHYGPDLAVVVGDPYTKGGVVNVQVRAPQGERWMGRPVVDVEVRLWGEHLGDHKTAGLALTSGDARVLARQLLHLADLIDLAQA